MIECGGEKCLERLRNRVAERFYHAPLGEVTKRSIGEIKGIMVDKIEGIEPPLAHLHGDDLSNQWEKL